MARPLEPGNRANPRCGGLSPDAVLEYVFDQRKSLGHSDRTQVSRSRFGEVI